VFGKVNSADKLYLVVESVKPDTSTQWGPWQERTARKGGSCGRRLRQEQDRNVAADSAGGAMVCRKALCGLNSLP
jgi:hypothetical protein